MTPKEIIQLHEEESEDLEVVEDGEWVQEHKYQHSTVIVKHVPTGEHWAIHRSRSGSYHTDWYYDDTTANRVERHEVVKTTIEWKAV